MVLFVKPNFSTSMLTNLFDIEIIRTCILVALPFHYGHLVWTFGFWVSGDANFTILSGSEWKFLTFCDTSGSPWQEKVRDNHVTHKLKGFNYAIGCSLVPQKNK